jgi:hypothetical protein
MRKCLIILMCIMLVLTVLAGCGSSKEKDETSFTATVLEIGESYLLVEPVEGSDELRSADKIRVSIGGATLLDSQDKEITVDDIEVGDKVEIVYNGVIAESYPAQINKCYRIKVLRENLVQ